MHLAFVIALVESRRMSVSYAAYTHTLRYSMVERLLVLMSSTNDAEAIHTPTFGVLDECTSAVSVEAEQKLYAAAFARGIACITVSQRLGLEEFHETELRFGANAPNYNSVVTQTRPAVPSQRALHR